MREIEDSVIDERCKGFSPVLGPFRLGDVADRGLNLLREDLTLDSSVYSQLFGAMLAPTPELNAPGPGLSGPSHNGPG